VAGVLLAGGPSPYLVSLISAERNRPPVHAEAGSGARRGKPEAPGRDHGSASGSRQAARLPAAGEVARREQDLAGEPAPSEASSSPAEAGGIHPPVLGPPAGSAPALQELRLPQPPAGLPSQPDLRLLQPGAGVPLSPPQPAVQVPPPGVQVPQPEVSVPSSPPQLDVQVPQPEVSVPSSPPQLDARLPVDVETPATPRTPSVPAPHDPPKAPLPALPPTEPKPAPPSVSPPLAQALLDLLGEIVLEGDDEAEAPRSAERRRD
jgi:hypothetical protein